MATCGVGSANFTYHRDMGLTWFGYVVLVLWIANAIAAVLMVGKIRKPTDPGTLLAQLILDALLILGLLAIGTGKL
jgi:hypothetical protein